MLLFDASAPCPSKGAGNARLMLTTLHLHAHMPQKHMHQTCRSARRQDARPRFACRAPRNADQMSVLLTLSRFPHTTRATKPLYARCSFGGTGVRKQQKWRFGSLALRKDAAPRRSGLSLPDHKRSLRPVVSSGRRGLAPPRLSTRALQLRTPGVRRMYFIIISILYFLPGTGRADLPQR